jgi:glucose-6-phosphate-specific signal transduction histidine kinase
MESELLFQLELTKRVIETKEQTLTNIAENHDNVGQHYLWSSKMNIQL